AELFSPGAGEVVEVNEALGDSPESLNSAPYSAWIFKLKPTDADADLAKLLDSAGYKSAIGE
ncbi:glycine cleavage system protein H, partial [Pseudomonas syringae]|nr:glycine cleavage system protein H [Pseudomonas syringae]